MVLAVPQVIQEIRDGHGLSLTAAGQRCGPGRDGRSGVNGSTVFRWCREGVRGPDGRRVKLEFCRVGSRMLTSGPAVERFIVSLSEPGDAENLTSRSPAATRRAAEAAGRELELMGC